MTPRCSPVDRAPPRGSLACCARCAPRPARRRSSTARVLALVLLLLAAGGAAVAAPGIANGVGRGVQRALCEVASRGVLRCGTSAARAPCAAPRRGGAVTAKLAFVRLGRGLGLLRAEQSDGSVDLTLLEHLDGGVEASVGAEGHLRLGRVELGGGGLLTARAVASLGGGRSWHLRRRGAADALQRRLVHVLAGKGASALPVVRPPARRGPARARGGGGRGAARARRGHDARRRLRCRRTASWAAWLDLEAVARRGGRAPHGARHGPAHAGTWRSSAARRWP